MTKKQKKDTKKTYNCEDLNRIKVLYNIMTARMNALIDEVEELNSYLRYLKPILPDDNRTRNEKPKEKN